MNKDGINVLTNWTTLGFFQIKRAPYTTTVNSRSSVADHQLCGLSAVTVPLHSVDSRIKIENHARIVYYTSFIRQ